MVPFTRTFHCCVIYCFSLCFMYTAVHCCEMCCKDYCCTVLWPYREINILLLLYRTHELHSIMPHPHPNPTPTRQPPTPNPNPQPQPLFFFYLAVCLWSVCLSVINITRKCMNGFSRSGLKQETFLNITVSNSSSLSRWRSVRSVCFL